MRRLHRIRRTAAGTAGAQLDGLAVHEQRLARLRDRLARRRSELGDDAVDAVRGEFHDLVSEGLRLVRDGIAPDDPRAREFVRRWDAVGERLNPDEDTKRAARAMWTDDGTEIAARMPWPAEEITALVAFVERAR